MRYVLFLVLFSLPGALPAWEWFMMKPAEMMDGRGVLLEVGFPSAGIHTGQVTVTDGTRPYCFYMANGSFWDTCPVSLAEGSQTLMKVIAMAKFRDPWKMYGVQLIIQGFNPVIQFIHADNFNTVYAVYTFDRASPPNDMTISDSQAALYYRDGTIWLGNKTGKVLVSTDEGLSWTPKTVTDDTEVEITSVRMTDPLHGWATGGLIETDTSGLYPAITLRSKGGLWETDDGGETWTTIFSGRDLKALDAAKDAGGRWYVRIQDEANIRETEQGDVLLPRRNSSTRPTVSPGLRDGPRPTTSTSAAARPSAPSASPASA
jgi:hypothetical protein